MTDLELDIIEECAKEAIECKNQNHAFLPEYCTPEQALELVKVAKQGRDKWKLAQILEVNRWLDGPSDTIHFIVKRKGLTVSTAHEIKPKDCKLFENKDN